VLRTPVPENRTAARRAAGLPGAVGAVAAAGRPVPRGSASPPWQPLLHPPIPTGPSRRRAARCQGRARCPGGERGTPVNQAGIASTSGQGAGSWKHGTTWGGLCPSPCSARGQPGLRLGGSGLDLAGSRQPPRTGIPQLLLPTPLHGGEVSPHVQPRPLSLSWRGSTGPHESCPSPGEAGHNETGLSH